VEVYWGWEDEFRENVSRCRVGTNRTTLATTAIYYTSYNGSLESVGKLRRYNASAVVVHTLSVEILQATGARISFRFIG
jgi:hypothetical protein